jgi:hypothetical protein
MQVPCEQLGALTLVDVPGLDDTNPFAYLVISKVGFPALFSFSTLVASLRCTYIVNFNAFAGT